MTPIREQRIAPGRIDDSRRLLTLQFLPQYSLPSVRYFSTDSTDDDDDREEEVEEEYDTRNWRRRRDLLLADTREFLSSVPSIQYDSSASTNEKDHDDETSEVVDAWLDRAETLLDGWIYAPSVSLTGVSHIRALLEHVTQVLSHLSPLPENHQLLRFAVSHNDRVESLVGQWFIVSKKRSLGNYDDSQDVMELSLDNDDKSCNLQSPQQLLQSLDLYSERLDQAIRASSTTSLDLGFLQISGRCLSRILQASLNHQPRRRSTRRQRPTRRNDNNYEESPNSSYPEDDLLFARYLLQRMLAMRFPPYASSVQSVLFRFAKLGDVESTIDLIEQIQRQTPPCTKEPIINIDCYNALLYAYAIRGLPEEAEKLLQDLCQGHYYHTYYDEDTSDNFDSEEEQPTQSVVLRPNLRTFNMVLAAWSRSLADDAPERAQALLYRLYDPFDYGAILDDRPDGVTLNTVLRSWARSKRPDAVHEAMTFLRERMEWSQAGMKEAQPDVVAYGIVLDALAKKGDGVAAEDLWEEMYQSFATGEAGSENLRPNLLTMTPVLQAWSKSDRSDSIERAEAWLDRMKAFVEQGLIPPLDESVYHVMMQVYMNPTGADAIELARRADRMFQNLSFKTFDLYSMLLHMYGKQHDKKCRQRSVELWNELIEKVHQNDEKFKTDDRSLDSILQACCQGGNTDLAFSIILHMCENASKGLGSPPHLKSFGSLIGAYKKKKIEDDPDIPKKAHYIVSSMRKLRGLGLLTHNPDYLMYHALLTCWSKSKSNEATAKMLSILEEMRSMYKSRQLDSPPDTVDYNIVLRSLARSYNPRRANSLLDQMIRDYKNGFFNRRSCPDLMSFHQVMLSWARFGRQESLDNIEYLFEQMENLSKTHKLDLMPDTIAYNNFLMALSQQKTAEAAERAEGVLNEMLEKSGRAKPSPLSFEHVIKSWLSVGDVNRADKILRLFHESCVQGQFSPWERPFSTVAEAWARSDAHRSSEVGRLWKELQLKQSSQGGIQQPVNATS